MQNPFIWNNLVVPFFLSKKQISNIIKRGLVLFISQPPTFFSLYDTYANYIGVFLHI